MSVGDERVLELYLLIAGLLGDMFMCNEFVKLKVIKFIKSVN